MKKVYMSFCAMLTFAQFVFADAPLAPEIYRKPDNFKSVKYIDSLSELSEKYSKIADKKAQKAMQKIAKVNSKGKYKPTLESLASHKAAEWFLDAKFGLFIDWGVYSVAGYAPKIKDVAMYPDWYLGRMYGDPNFREYHEKNWGKDFYRDDFIQLFTAENFDASKFANYAKKVGAKYMLPFGKHHCGYC